MKFKLLDLFCGSGGAGYGYHLAGFEVTGVDVIKQKNYPLEFVQDDAISYLKKYGHLYDVIHASPPCQAYSNSQRIRNNHHEDMIDEVREVLIATGKPWIIENVPGSPLREPVQLCGAMFELETYRHRLFETNWILDEPDHPKHIAPLNKMGRYPNEGEFMHVVGNFVGAEKGREVMQMPWASRNGLREAIPPAYTKYIGDELMKQLESENGIEIDQPVDPFPLPKGDNPLKLLDLYCGVGGAGWGYAQAGFEVTGVDINPQKNYPFEFIQADAVEYVKKHGHKYDVIHASPPCQAYTAMTTGTNAGKKVYDETLLNATREALSDHRYTIIENVVGAPVREDLKLCGEMFGLRVIRHRLFECSFDIEQPKHIKHRSRVNDWRHGERFEGYYLAIYGTGGGRGSVDEWKDAMQMTWPQYKKEIAQAIPPAYAKYIGDQLMELFANPEDESSDPATI